MIAITTGTVGRINLLRRLIDSARRSVGDLPYRFFIVDNNSQDGSKEWLQAQPDVTYLNAGDPRGAAYAFQMGYEACTGEYVCHLNDDIAVEGDTIARAYRHLEAHPECGQVAFHHKYQNRAGVDPQKAIIQKVFGGYTYAQTGMTRKWLGDIAGWTGLHSEGYTHYAWDNYLSARIWELGWRVDAPGGCCVIDWEHIDNIRKRFSDGMRTASGGVHPDTVKFMQAWRGRLPNYREWVNAITPTTRLLYKASRGQLRTLRFKSMMNPRHTNERTALIEEFGKLGPAQQYNHTAAVEKLGIVKFQDEAVRVVKEFNPDLLMLQAQRDNNVWPITVARLRKVAPNAYIFNWDADTHYPLEPFHFEIARACDLQLTISKSVFPEYLANGVHNIGMWSIGVENEYLDQERGNWQEGPDITFLGTLFGIGKFPEATTRRDAVIKLRNEFGKGFVLHGGGWRQAGIRATYTGEKHSSNAHLYSRSKMALSISQTAEMWGYTSDRGYNIMATGCPILMQRFPGMEDVGFIDGETVIAWSTLDEMMEKAHHYLENDDEREAIGAAGKLLIQERHTWRSRVDDLLGML